MNFILVGIFFSFLAGEIFCLLLKPSFFLLLFLGCLSLFSCFLFYKRKNLFLSDFSLLFLFFFLGGLWFNPYSLDIPSQFLKKEVKIVGKVEDSPRNYLNCSFYKIRSNHIFCEEGTFYFPGSISVKDYSSKEVSAFDLYLFKGYLIKNFSKRGYTLYLKRGSPPLKLKSTKDFRKLALRVREKLSSLFRESFPDRIYTFISAVFLGVRQEEFYSLGKIFAQAGTSHILAISGLHIGIIGVSLILILRLLGFKRKTRLILSLPLILFYSFICGARPPVLRASLMFWLYSLSFLLRRKFLLFNSLALAGLIDLILRADDFLDISFQLSFIAVFSIGLGFRYFYSPRKFTLFEKIRILFLTSLFANLGLMGLISFYFGKIYLLSILVNVIVIPYLSLIFYCLFIFLGISFIKPVSELISLSCSFLISFFLKMNYFFATLPLSYLSYRFSWGGLLGYYLFILAIVVLRVFVRRRA